MADQTWYLFYSATGKNGSATRKCITEPTGCESSQMVASSVSPHGPWKKLGYVARAMNDGSWNERLVDSGRALLVNGKRGYYGIGFLSLAHDKTAAVEDIEGVYFPEDPASFRPPYKLGVPLNTSSDANYEGYENCEFLPLQGMMHVLCTDHHSGKCYNQGPGPGGAHHASNLSCVAHFIANEDLSVWTLQERITTKPALEPTFVYEGAVGNEANVSYSIARTIDPLCSPTYLACEDIALYRVTWVPMGTPPPPAPPGESSNDLRHRLFP
jgi:hypothetical protein